MAQEKYLTKTKDNKILVFTIDYVNQAEKARKEAECRNICQNKTYNEFIDAHNDNVNHHIPVNYDFDNDNSFFILNEMTGYRYYKNRAAYQNSLLTASYPPAANQPNVFHFNALIDDNLVPEMIKNIGFNIVPCDEIYDVTYNPAKRSYDIMDSAGNPYKTRVATVFHNENRMEVVRNHFRFAPNDYNRLITLVQEYERQKQQNPALSIVSYTSHLHDNRDHALMRVYEKAYNPDIEKQMTILHELKHIKNAIFSAGVELKKDARRLNIDDLYRLKVEDERSAYFNEWISCINTYLQRGNFSDYSMFDNCSHTVVTKLRNMRTDAEKQAYVTDYNRLMEDFASWFQANKQSYYERQFSGNLAAAVQNLSLSSEPDTDRREYQKLRSLYFRYEIYNPQTRRMEFKNLSPYMPEYTIEDNVRTTVIARNEETLRRRMDDYNNKVAAGTITPSLLQAAKKLLRDNVSGGTFVNQVDDIQIATLYDENTPQPDGTNPQQPGNGNNTPPPPSHAPDDHADWSDNLKNYWSHVAGYHEIAKNNDEYRFKINNATIRYENAKKVQVSSNATYDLYVKLLHEPTNAGRSVEFLPNLTREQALTLYVACINNGRRVKGNVPTDLSGIENIQGIPPAALNRFRHIRAANGSRTARTSEAVQTKRNYMSRQKADYQRSYR